MHIQLGSHALSGLRITVTCVKQINLGICKEGKGLQRTRIHEIPSTATITQIPNHKTTEMNDISKQHSK